MKSCQWAVIRNREAGERTIIHSEPEQPESESVERALGWPTVLRLLPLTKPLPNELVDELLEAGVLEQLHLVLSVTLDHHEEAGPEIIEDGVGSNVSVPYARQGDTVRFELGSLIRRVGGPRTEPAICRAVVKHEAEDASVEIDISVEGEDVIDDLACLQEWNEIAWRAERVDDGDLEADILEDGGGEPAEGTGLFERAWEEHGGVG